jgi:hypothetical protein
MEKALQRGYLDNIGYVVVNATTGRLMPDVDLMGPSWENSTLLIAAKKMQALRLLYTSQRRLQTGKYQETEVKRFYLIFKPNDFPKDVAILFAYPPLNYTQALDGYSVESSLYTSEAQPELNLLPRDSTIMDLFRYSNVSYNGYYYDIFPKITPSTFNGVPDLVIHLSQPFYNRDMQYVGAMGVQFDGPKIIKAIVDANILKSDFIFDQFVIYDVKDMT